jgi:hypothetical protein
MRLDVYPRGRHASTKWDRDSDHTDIRDSYDSAANAYAEHLFLELAQKPLDRHILDPTLPI